MLKNGICNLDKILFIVPDFLNKNILSSIKKSLYFIQLINICVTYFSNIWYAMIGRVKNLNHMHCVNCRKMLRIMLEPLLALFL